MIRLFKNLVSHLLNLLEIIIGQVGSFIKKRNHGLYVGLRKHLRIEEILRLRKTLKTENGFDKFVTPIGFKNLSINLKDGPGKSLKIPPSKNTFKIVQSFAQFENGCLYANGLLENKEVYLNFYSFLLSFLTLKKYYGEVTMYCNQRAYDTFIKYIPYDEIVIKENRFLTHKYWSAYKLDVIADIKTPFIHVDSDVFIFDDLFRPFIDNQDKYDVMVQNILPKDKNISLGFVKDNAVFLKNNNLLGNNYDGKCLSCGVIGMNSDVKEKFIFNTTKIYNAMENEEVKLTDLRGMILEELTFYFTVLQNNYRIYDILPYNKVYEFGECITGDNHNYTHMWFSTKFKKKNIDLIKNKIKEIFPGEYYLIKIYEQMLKKGKIKLKTFT